MKTYEGIQAPYGEMGEMKLEGKGDEQVLPSMMWLLATGADALELERIIRSVAILSRRYPEASIEAIVETAVIWERG